MVALDSAEERLLAKEEAAWRESVTSSLVEIVGYLGYLHGFIAETPQKGVYRNILTFARWREGR